MIKIERPKVVDSKTYTETIACGKIYITVGLKEGEPIEVFIMGHKSAGCKASQEAIGRLASILLQYRLGEEVVNQLTGIICNACSRKKGELPQSERKDFPNSCGDAIGKIINLHLKENK